MTTTDRGIDMIQQRAGDDQSAIRRRLDEVWAAAAARDFERLESFHLYGPEFTSFKEGGLREDAAANAAGERGMFSTLDGPAVDMRDLAIAVFGRVGLVTFNGHFTATVHGTPIAMDQQATMVLVDVDGDWKIVHEHMSPLQPAGSPA